jgi:hypothetical protein
MPLLREIKIRRTEETITLSFKRRDGTVLASVDIKRNVDPDQPIPLDIWVPNVDDLIIDPPNAAVTLVWDEEPLGGLRMVQLLRRVPPHDVRDYVRYPALIAKEIVRAGWGRAVSDEEVAEINSPRLYIPAGTPHFGARKD